MSQKPENNPSPLGYLLLRDGHAVPLAGIEPAQLKAGARQVIPNTEADRLAHRLLLTAIVDRLGFPGDFGDFKNREWPRFQQFLRLNDCHHQTQVFVGCADLFLRPRRRALTDRIFESDQPMPKRVFLGYGVDWDGVWSREIRTGGEAAASQSAFAALYARRFDFIEQLGFLDDKLVWGEVKNIVDHTYWHDGIGSDVRAANHANLLQSVQALRAVIDTFTAGWVDILRYNSRLAVLRAADGSWDVLWRAYRAAKPPATDPAQRFQLAFEDTPSSLKEQLNAEQFLYLRQGIHDGERVWEEWESHAAEQAFYERGHTPAARRMTPAAEVRMAWLREQEQLSFPPKRHPGTELPPGFGWVEIHGQRLAMSEYISVGEYRAMLDDTGYLARRRRNWEPWERCNLDESDAAPVGASWLDAQAFCAWMEKKLATRVRLPTHQELRSLHPFYAEHYARLAHGDFLWEHYPPRPLSRGDAHGAPRIDVPSAVQWSEPRFLEPGPDLSEFPAPSGISAQSRRRFIQDFPPRANWSKNLPIVDYAGLKFVDAWDAGEWCQAPGKFHGRFWEGIIDKSSWGAYKNMKITFRLVLDWDD